MAPLKVNKIVVMCDLDGCLIDDRHRRHLCDWSNRDFKKYHDAMVKDTMCFAHMREILTYHYGMGHDIYLTTARPETHRAQTQEQIKKFFGWHIDNDRLLMRKETEEGVPSAELKSGMLSEIKSRYQDKDMLEIIGYDDHGDVLKAYFERGVQAYFVNDQFILNYGRYPQQIANYRKGERFKAATVRADHFGIECGVWFSSNAALTMLFDNYCKGRERIVEWFPAENTHAARIAVFDEPSKADTQLAKDIQTLSSYDSRQEVLRANHIALTTGGDEKKNESRIDQLIREWTLPDCANVPRILEMSAETFADRREIYGDSSDQFGRIMAILMERSEWAPSLPGEHEMYMFVNHIVGKLVRFANSGFEHVDSIHDIINYAALAESKVIGIDLEIKRVENEPN